MSAEGRPPARMLPGATRSARRLGLRVIMVDGSQGVAGLVDLVEGAVPSLPVALAVLTRAASSGILMAMEPGHR